ncbi:MAG TPA: hypothetical protein VES20_22845 [Bryobacteraceae bacterium]|nr:hypothetical protein [Bryobacteraceae bacterium]
MARSLSVLALIAFAVQPVAAAESSWLSHWFTPVLHMFSFGPSSPGFGPSPDLPHAATSCFVAPLAAVEDSEAIAFETVVGTPGVVHLAGLTPATGDALHRFQRIVRSAGGDVDIKSAYRPLAYQAHLQELWDKWMVELRFNTLQECQELRADVLLEFTRHGLLESQRPATTSDHTRGLAFDAVVALPRTMSTLDILARRAGLYRPVAVADPVHFRLAD